MANRAPITILIAEDNPVTVSLLTRFIQRDGHTLIVAENGQQALELFEQQSPDMILMDINMPIMNGIEAIEAIRAKPTDIWVPIIILSALSDEKDILHGLNAGADDYLPKPISLEVLSAKIKGIERFIALQKTNMENARLLYETNEGLEQQQVLAKKLADKMLDLGNINHENVMYWLRPAQKFSGDLIAASQTDDGKLFVMVADSTGHGLAASLPTLNIASIFHSMSTKGFRLSRIVAEMNRSLKNLLPPDRFVAASVFAIDFKQCTIEWWAGGLPTGLLVSPSGEVLHEFKSNHLAIGILPPEIFDCATSFYQWQSPCELIVFSDGLTEAINPEGVMLGEDALMNIIKTSGHRQRVPSIKEHLLEYMRSDQSNDDISVLSITCDNVTSEQ